MREWIPVTERMPEPFQPVIVCREKYNAYKKQRMEEEARKKRSSDIPGQMMMECV